MIDELAQIIKTGMMLVFLEIPSLEGNALKIGITEKSNSRIFCEIEERWISIFFIKSSKDSFIVNEFDHLQNVVKYINERILIGKFFCEGKEYQSKIYAEIEYKEKIFIRSGLNREAVQEAFIETLNLMLKTFNTYMPEYDKPVFYDLKPFENIEKGAKNRQKALNHLHFSRIYYRTYKEFLKDINIIEFILSCSSISKFFFRVEGQIKKWKEIKFPKFSSCISVYLYLMKIDENMRKECDVLIKRISNANPEIQEGQIKHLKIKDLSKFLSSLEFSIRTSFVWVPRYQFNEIFELSENSSVANESKNQVEDKNLNEKFSNINFNDLALNINVLMHNTWISLIKIPEKDLKSYVNYFLEIKRLCSKNLLNIIGLYVNETENSSQEYYFVTDKFTEHSFANYFEAELGTMFFQKFYSALTDLLELIKYFQSMKMKFPLYICEQLLDYSNGIVKLIPSFMKIENFMYLAPDEMIEIGFAIYYKEIKKRIKSMSKLDKSNYKTKILQAFMGVGNSSGSKIRDILKKIKMQAYEKFLIEDIKVDEENKNLIIADIIKRLPKWIKKRKSGDYVEQNEIYRIGILIYRTFFYKENKDNIPVYFTNSQSFSKHYIQVLLQMRIASVYQSTQEEHSLCVAVMREMLEIDAERRISSGDILEKLKQNITT